MKEVLEQGGPMTLFILALAGMGTFVSFERLFFFIGCKVNVRNALIGIALHLRNGQFKEASIQARRIPGPAGEVIHAVLLRHDLNRQDLRDIAQETGQLQVPLLERNLRILLGIALLSPLVGILGTIIGFISTYQRLTEEIGISDPRSLSEGIYQALISSALGLSLAIPMYILYLFFLGRAKVVAHSLERTGIEIINLVNDIKTGHELVSTESAPEELVAEECSTSNQTASS